MAQKSSSTTLPRKSPSEPTRRVGACRAQFLTDPERYSQLYDALLELEAEGTPVRAAMPSLVPS